MSYELNKYLAPMKKFGASDLHIKNNASPIYRVNGTPRPTDSPALNYETIKKMVLEILTDQQKEQLETTGSTDLAHSIENVDRYRVNIFKQCGAISIVARRINDVIPSVKQLNLPTAVEKISTFKEGLILIAGVTGSGKSTTLAAILEMINAKRKCHILTIEDPVEFIFTDKQSFINQREIGLDVDTFENALKGMLRQDPDVILLGEMHDAESFEAALSAAETGHLVFGTIHAPNAVQTINRILDLFPTDRHRHIRRILSGSLKGILVQKLLKGTQETNPRVPAVEILFQNPMVSKIINEGEDAKLAQVIEGSAKVGMQNFNQSLYQLVKAKLLNEETALKASPNAEQLKMKFSGINLSQSGGVIG